MNNDKLNTKPNLNTSNAIREYSRCSCGRHAILREGLFWAVAECIDKLNDVDNKTPETFYRILKTGMDDPMCAKFLPCFKDSCPCYQCEEAKRENDYLTDCPFCGKELWFPEGSSYCRNCQSVVRKQSED